MTRDAATGASRGEHGVVGEALLASTVRALDHRLARSQADCRLPSLVGGVVHDGEVAWTGAAGTVDDQTPSRDTQYRMGSITKTFTAVLVLQLRDEGRLDLDDTVEAHVPGTPVGDRTIASLLAHTSGLQAETAGDWWERTGGGDFDDLVAPLDAGGVLAAAGRHHHYSNLAYGILGEVIQRLRGVSWMEALTDGLLGPLELTRTTYGPSAPHAEGWAVHPWADLLMSEPSSIHDAGAMAPAGQLWASVADLLTWGRFLAGDTADVLSDDTLEEMCEPIVVHDPAWTVGHGLGMQVFRRGDRVWVGHGGSMPGFLAHLLVDRSERAAAVTMANATSGLDAAAGDMLEDLVTREPRMPSAWDTCDVPAEVLPALGPWYWGPSSVALRYTDGHLRLTDLDSRARESRFVSGGDGTWRGLDGYYRGETLVIRTSDDGEPTHLELATFVFTRTPYDPSAPVPGGVDPAGWQP